MTSEIEPLSLPSRRRDGGCSLIGWVVAGENTPGRTYVPGMHQ